MAYVRLTRDPRGFETTLLLHAPYPGADARVLYCYRTAPSVRMGRPAFDEEAIRLVEQQHPEIDFDWSLLFEEARAQVPESDPSEGSERPYRRSAPRPPVSGLSSPVSMPRQGPSQRPTPSARSDPRERVAAGHAPPPDASPAAIALEPVASTATNALLDALAGREIAGKLRARYADLIARATPLPAGSARDEWLRHVSALDPDSWLSPEAVLQGVQGADTAHERALRDLPPSAR